MSDERDEAIEQIRQRAHDLSGIVHAHAAKLAVQELQVAGVKEQIVAMTRTMATQEQLASSANIVTVKIDNVAASVNEVRRWVIAGVSVVMSAVILAVIALILQHPK